MIPKFRAWLKDVGEMVEVLEIDFYNKEVAYIWTEQVSDYELEQTREVDKLKDVILMQSTGLRDKNGVEIFGGDIVKGYSVYPEPSIFEPFLMGEVYYTNYGTWDSCSYILGEINEQVEVIGNIYENKELIEVECN